MISNTSKIISLLINDTCFKERKDHLGGINSGSNHYFYLMLIDLKKLDHLSSSKHSLAELKPYFNSNEELLQYYDALMNAIHMDEIKKTIASIYSNFDLIHDEMHANLIKVNYKHEEFTGMKTFIENVNTKLEYIKRLISGYNTLRDVEHINISIKQLKNIFKENNSFNIVIDKLADSILYDSKCLMAYKASLFKYYAEKT